jgi:very-short-patch-repair endonuclease
MALVLRHVSAADRRLIELADPRAESGLESIVRLLVMDLGFQVRIQVPFAGVGRVDLLVEDRVIVETDGDEFHDEKVTTKDRRRDAALVARGYTVLRFRYAQVLYELESVGSAIIAAVATHRGIHNSGISAARARHRLRRMEFS